MLRAVDGVLDEIGADSNPRLLVLNKADALDAERREEVLVSHPNATLVSALTGEGLDELRTRVEEAFSATLHRIELLVPYADGGRLAELHDLVGELEREDTPEGVRITAQVPQTVAERFARFSVNGHRNGSSA
jgi:GTP-binding protein HflX